MRPTVIALSLLLGAGSLSGEPPAPPKAPRTRAEAQALMDDAARDFLSLQTSHGRIVSGGERLVKVAQQAAGDAQARASRLRDLVVARAPQATLLEATKSLEEAQMSFNLQYLQLQSQMQHENRSYTAVSNIMKTKHETVKNSISNIR
jgi:hypothetical protein